MDRGIEYVEVRLLDIDPFSPVGIDAQTCRLLDVFLLGCLLSPSPPDSQDEDEAISRNKRLVAEAGRDSQIRLERAGEPIAPVDWGREVLHEGIPIAAALDEAQGGRLYAEALETAQRRLDDFSLLPSARVLHQVEHVHAGSFREFALAQSRLHRDKILSLPLAAEAKARLASEAAQSLVAQRRLEAEDDVPFETYRQRYLAQITPG
jgi:glutamate--cysteine ligase